MTIAPAVLAVSKTVGITDTGYDPGSTTVSTGDAVTWANLGTKEHAVTADDGSFDSGPLNPGNQFANVFDHAGTFAYHSSSDPTFHGTVVVNAAPITPTPATFVPTPPPGTLPPGFSPHPIVTEPPLTAAPPTPTPSAIGTLPASSGSSLAFVLVALLVAVVLVVILLRSRTARSRAPNRRERRRRG